MTTISPQYYTQSIDHPHQGSRKVVSDVQHGALLAGVDEAIAADRHGEQDHGRGGMVPSEGGPWGATKYLTPPCLSSLT